MNKVVYEIEHALINASCLPVTEVAGSVYFDICESFTMTRGGHVDVTVMGAYQLTAGGAFSSWYNPARAHEGVGNIGGSMDLAVGDKNCLSPWSIPPKTVRLK